MKDVGQGLGPDADGPDDPVRPVLRLPDDVRGDHAGADHRGHGRPAEVRGLRACSSGSGSVVVYSPGRPLGVRRRLAGPRWARSTSPVARSSTSTPASPRWRSSLVLGRRRLAPGGADAAALAAPARCSAPASCGSAGSGSTPARRSPPTASPARPLMNTFLAASAGMLGWLVVERIKDGTPRRSARPRARSPGSWPSRRAPGSSAACRRMAIGFIAGIVCFLAIQLEVPRCGYDDSLDVIGVHLVGGLDRLAAARALRRLGGQPRWSTNEGLFFGGRARRCSATRPWRRSRCWRSPWWCRSCWPR